MGSKHTELPWQLEYKEDEGEFTIWAGSAIEERHTGCYQSVGEIQLGYYTYPEDVDFEESKANAQFIVKAVNNHDKLVEATKLGLEFAKALEESLDCPLKIMAIKVGIGSIQQALNNLEVNDVEEI